MSLVYIWAAFCLGWVIGAWWATGRTLRRRGDQIDKLFHAQFQERVNRLMEIRRN